MCKAAAQKSLHLHTGGQSITTNKICSLYMLFMLCFSKKHF